MDVNQLLDNIDRRIYELEQLLTSSTGPGSNAFDSIIINNPGGGSPVTISYTSSPPTSLVVTPGTYFDTNYADVSWTPPVDGSGDTYQVEWAKKNGPGSYDLINALGGLKGNSFRIPNLLNNQDYGVRVYTINKAGVPSTPLPSSGYTDFHEGIDASAPASPTGLVVVSTIKGIIARINPNTERDTANGKGVYRFELATDAGFTSIIKTNNEGGVVSYFPDLEVNTQYWVRAWAIDASGNLSTGAVSGTATTSFVVGSDTSMLPSGSNWVKNSIFIRDSNADGYPDYWSTNASISNTQGVIIESSPGGVQGSALKITAASGGDYYNLQSFALTKGKWCVGCRVKRTSVTPGTGKGSGLNLDFPSGSFALVRHWGTTAAGSEAWDSINTGTNDWRWEWVVVDITTDTAVANVYLQQGYAGTCTGTTRFGEVQVERGDTPTAWHGIPPQIVTADEVFAGSMTTAIFTVNTLNGDRLLANSAVIEKLSSSSMTSVDITLSGGSFKAGSPPTTGLLINSQGLRLYSGGSQTVTIDVGGTASFTGTITATAGSIGSLTINGDLRLTGGGVFRSNSAGLQRVEITSSFINEVGFYTGSGSETNRGYLQVGGGGALVFKSPSMNFGTGDLYTTLSLGTTTLDLGGYGRSSATFRQSGTDDLWNDVGVHGTLAVYSAISTVGGISVGTSYNGVVCANAGGSQFGGDINWGLAWRTGYTYTGVGYSTDYATELRYYSTGASDFRRTVSIIDQRTGTIIAGAANDGTFAYLSSRGIKTKIKKMASGTLEDLMNLRPVSHGLRKFGNNRYSGLISQEVGAIWPDAVVGSGEDASGIVPAAMISRLVHAIQETTIEHRKETLSMNEKIESLLSDVAVLKSHLIKAV